MNIEWSTAKRGPATFSFTIISVSPPVTAVEGQGQTRTPGTQPRGRIRRSDDRGDRVRFCDYRSEKEGKTVGDNAGERPGSCVRGHWNSIEGVRSMRRWIIIEGLVEKTKQETRAGKLEAQ
jgi:hypothetical protein